MIITIAIQSKNIRGRFLSLPLSLLNSEPIITISPIIFIILTVYLFTLCVITSFIPGLSISILPRRPRTD